MVVPVDGTRVSFVQPSCWSVSVFVAVLAFARFLWFVIQVGPES